MKNAKLLVAALLSLSSLQTWAQTLLVTDMDDTIKVSYVLDKDSAVANAAMIHNAFLGMPHLYKIIENDADVIAIKYLSNAPRKLIGDLHEKFLNFNHFPKGEFVARSWFDLRSGNAHKVNSLRRFIKQYKPKALILVGDNGEADVEVYNQIRTEFPHILGPTYIRQAYSSFGFSDNFAKPLEDNQTPFASSIDIAMDLYKRGYLRLDSFTQHINKIVPAILAEEEDENRGATAFPEWYDCRDFVLPELPLLLDVHSNLLLQKYAHKVQIRCQMEPADD